MSGDYPRGLKISSSLDGKNFTELKTDIVGERYLTIGFESAQYARYLKLELVTHNALWWRIDELDVLQ